MHLTMVSDHSPHHYEVSFFHSQPIFKSEGLVSMVMSWGMLRIGVHVGVTGCLSDTSFPDRELDAVVLIDPRNSNKMAAVYTVHTSLI